ncbi:MAG: response regulator [Verrucomicrobium sp.]
MENEEFLGKLREAFAAEAAEHVQSLTTGLLAAEACVDSEVRREIMETIFREAHSLKGAAGAVEHTGIQSICQALESLFSGWKQTPGKVICAESYDAANAAVDAVNQMLHGALPAEGSPASMEVSDVIRRIESQPPDSPTAARPQPADRRIAACPPTTTATTGDAESIHLADTVRIPVPKMDALLRQVEEMLAAKLVTSQHTLALKSLGVELETWQQRWLKLRSASGLPSVESETSWPEFMQWSEEHFRLLEKQIGRLTSTAAQDEKTVAGLVDQLLEDTKRLVMLPCGTLFDFFPKVVRDLSRELGKDATLNMLGREVEMDKRVLQELKDPLLHLVRNALDHGIEDKQTRLERGKTERGSLTITAVPRDGSKVEITISDDGGGIDSARLKAAAISTGHLSEGDTAMLDESAIQALVFRSGLSTSSIITEISGRGLGMAIVQEKVEKLGGNVSILSHPGQGTTFRIVVPVTQSTFKGILVEAGGQTFVIPTANVDRVGRHRRADILTVENRETVLVDGQRLPLVDLAGVLELPPSPHHEKDAPIVSVILGGGGRRVAFAVMSVLNEQEVLVKRLTRPLSRIRNVMAATILGSGSPAVILNVTDLLHSALKQPGNAGRHRPEAAPLQNDSPARKILVTDDSITSRMLLKNILQSAGFEVTVAVDGMDAYTALKSHPYDLLVSDVQMPRMDGFDLTSKIRSDKKLADLPVVLVTALASREDRERGVDVGANAYVVKGSFDQSNLLEVIRKLI